MDHQKIDSSLNACAVSFVQALLNKDNSFTIDTIEVRRQWKHIDVTALVNDKYFLVIEDEKGTENHSGQLDKYSGIAEGHYEKSDIEIKLVYFKMEEQSNLDVIEAAGYSIFRRKQMLNILNTYVQKPDNQTGNNILLDYHSNLLELDNQIEGFRTLPIDKWELNSWQGFYSELQKQFIDGKWHYDYSRSRRFFIFWWNYISCPSKTDGKSFEYYLQLEHDKFVFKVHAYKENERREIRDFYQTHLFKKAKEKMLEFLDMVV